MTISEEELQKTWGLAARNKRLDLKMTVDAVAEAVGVDRATVVRWENGSVEPQIPHRISLAKALDMNPNELWRYPS